MDTHEDAPTHEPQQPGSAVSNAVTSTADDGAIHMADGAIHMADGAVHMTDGAVHMTDGAVHIADLTVDDPVLVDLVARHDPGQRADVVRRMLAVGARGVVSMGVGLELSDVDRRVRSAVEEALSHGRREVVDAIEELRAGVTGELDPSHTASTLSRCLRQLDDFRGRLEAAVDPGRTDSHTSRLLTEITSMLGPGGVLEDRLGSLLDPDGDGSALATTLGRLERRLDELHGAMAEDRGRRTEADRGTAKGFAYEDDLEWRLRQWAGPVGALVERTSDVEGSRGTDLVGDFVVTLPDGIRVVVEAKHVGVISLHGSTGILAECRRAVDNRAADAAVCISRTDAFPTEVGTFGVYGDTVLAVDDAEGTMLAVAMTWASNQARAQRRGARGLDTALVAERIGRIRSLATQLSGTKRSLTEISTSVDKVRASVDSIRVELLELASDVDVALSSEAAGEVIDLGRAMG